MIPGTRARLLSDSKMIDVSALVMLSEEEFKKWIADAIREYFAGSKTEEQVQVNVNEPLLCRTEAAGFLRISLVTLTDWTKHGLPHYRLRGRIYYTKSEMLGFLRREHASKLKFSDKYQSISSE